jgi:hypothetical protein
VFPLRRRVIARCFYSLLVLGRSNMSSSTAQLAERSALIARILVTEADLKAFHRHLEDVLRGKAFRGSHRSARS